MVENILGLTRLGECLGLQVGSALVKQMGGDHGDGGNTSGDR